MILNEEYNIIIDEFNFPLDESFFYQKFIKDYPVVYIINDKNNKNIYNAYIGETTNFKNRMYNHSKDSERRKLNKVLVIGCEKFNQSATFNIETNLIQLMFPDDNINLQNSSKTKQMQMHNYYQKSIYNNTIFNLIWEALRDRNFVDKSIDEIRNTDIFKLSPHNELSDTQFEIKEQIISFCEENIDKKGNSVFYINGEAGTGKSVLISSVYARLQELSKSNDSDLKNKNNYLLVNHEEVLKTYKGIAKKMPYWNINKILKPTSFINKDIEADITIVDEAHLLLSKADPYNNFRQDNQLEEIIKKSKITIVLFDEKQFLKAKSYWNKKELELIINKNAKYIDSAKLSDQFRMNADIKIINWINDLVEKKEVNNINLKDINDDYEFKIFDSAKKMYEEIQEKNSHKGLSRIVASFDYLHKKDGGTYFVEEEEFKLPWNSTNFKEAWAENPNTINEVGSVYTIQGFDLNYVGVIIGPSISYDEVKNKIVINPDLYKDKEAFKFLTNISNSDEIKEKIILNSLNVLLKRGVHGLYIYASDEKLRKKLLSEVKYNT